MDLITTTSELAAVCDRLAKHKVITVDTEFLRETTYYPLLCVVQMASADEAVVVDAGADSNPDPRRREWPAVALAGVIYTARPGLDVDIGYRAGLNAAAIARVTVLPTARITSASTGRPVAME